MKIKLFISLDKMVLIQSLQVRLDWFSEILVLSIVFSVKSFQFKLNKLFPNRYEN